MANGNVTHPSSENVTFMMMARCCDFMYDNVEVGIHLMFKEKQFYKRPGNNSQNELQDPQ